MPDPSDLVPWKELSKPLVKILDMVQSGFGAVWESHGIVRRARSEAKAALIKARADVETQELKAQVADRLLAQEARRFQNFESIVRHADREMPRGKGAPRGIVPDEDWIAAFVNYAQDVSDLQMQQLWSKLLAGEVKKPKSFSRRTLSVVRDLGREEAGEFANLCAWRVQFVDPPEVFLVRPPMQGRRMPSYDIDNLASIGLIYVEREELQAHSFRTKQFVCGNRWWQVEYAGEPTKEAIYQLPLGIAQLTRAGEELARLIPWKEEETLPQRIEDYWKAAGWEVRPSYR